MKKKDNYKQLKKIARIINSISCFIMLLIIIFLLVRYDVFQEKYTIINQEYHDPLTANYNTASLDNSKTNIAIKYGYELFQNTPKHIGPNNGKDEMVYAGNNLSCTNCHLQAGTKPYSGLLIGIINRFPQFRGRENKMGIIEERINGCMERSMNGKKLPIDGEEMKAFVSYLSWLSRYAPEDGKLKGVGYASIEIPNRVVNLDRGASIFKTKCSVCHGIDGKGIKLNNSPVYQYPPLWGEDSFNNGAGMTRVITAAQFIKSNMPFGATYENPLLTDEEAYDVAGYINQQERPLKSNPENDFPDLKRKPVSTPYPPYADDFSIQQHQMGPFQPIMDYYMLKHGMKKTK
ncbi:Cytochrome c family protein [hydrothermal vent metagenome]|uniref:Cytochrome c family protein n=1 Tax=hydrothermal vent metagenome TaxID=652676 RepID=A0A3B0RGQ1_9ZZZZ